EEGFDARKLFNFPVNPDAMDLLIIQKPGMTLSQVMKDASEKLRIPYDHIVRVIQKNKEFKRREDPYPIHPYLIEFAKVLPHFLLMGLGALVLYNQSIGDRPIVRYLWDDVISKFALAPSSLWWALPLFGSLVLSVLAHLTRIYRFEARMLPHQKPDLFLDATLTSLFVKRHSPLPRANPSPWWNPNLYEWPALALRAFGFLWLGLALLHVATSSFATFLVVKGLIAMLAFTEVAAIILPLAGTALSKWLQDWVTAHPTTWGAVKFANRLNLTATMPASPTWLSIKYHTQPSVPSGGFAGMAQSIIFYFLLAAVFFFVGGFLCQQIFS